MASDPTIGVVVPTWNRAREAERCLTSLAGLAYTRCFTIVVDNASRADQRAVLLAAAKRQDVRVLQLAENRGFAGGVNAGLSEVFARGAAAALVLNDDAEVEPGLLGALAEAAAADPQAGILAPRVLDATSGRELSRGERVVLPFICLPRTWLRVRRGGVTPYAVSGVLGVAFLVTRACFERIGPLAEAFFAYYEEVDYCLRVRAAGLKILVVPAASIRHTGFRGFASGFTPLAAYLKARNLPLVLRRHGRLSDWMVFLPTYVALVAASAIVYAARDDGLSIIRALARGVADALRARGGPPPRAVPLPVGVR